MIGTSSARVSLGGRLQAAPSAAARPCPIGARPGKRLPGSRARSQRVSTPSSRPSFLFLLVCCRNAAVGVWQGPSECRGTGPAACVPPTRRGAGPRYRRRRSTVLLGAKHASLTLLSLMVPYPLSHSGPGPQQRAGVGRPAPDVATARSRAQRAAARRRGQLPGAPPTQLCEQKGWFRCKRLSFRTCCGGG